MLESSISLSAIIVLYLPLRNSKYPRTFQIWESWLGSIQKESLFSFSEPKFNEHNKIASILPPLGRFCICLEKSSPCIQCSLGRDGFIPSRTHLNSLLGNERFLLLGQERHSTLTLKWSRNTEKISYCLTWRIDLQIVLNFAPPMWEL